MSSTIAQAAYWALPATGQRLIAGTAGPSQFASEVAPVIPAGASVVDLGSGTGHDTAVLAAAAGKSGTVFACDVNEDLLVEAVARASAPDSAPVHPVCLNPRTSLLGGLPVSPGTVDVVYAHLSLHYFDEVRTRALFEEIRTLLRPGGVFAVACKSVGDPSYGKGTPVGQDTFADGPHLRHFFSASYLTGLLSGFRMLSFTDEVRELYGFPSAVVTAIACR